MEKNNALLQRVKEEKTILTVYTIQRRKVNWFGRILLMNCLLIHVIEGKIEGIRRRGRRRKHLLDDLKERKEATLASLDRLQN
jgi:hypothetical protein